MQFEQLINQFFNWRFFTESLPLLLGGARLTVFFAITSQLIGFFLGLLLAMLKIQRMKALRWPAVIYIDLFRGTPLLMQIFLLYYALPYMGVNVDPYTAGIMALGLNVAAYDAEILRAGIESISKGQMEAARSLGMTYLQAMRYVVLPQTVRRVLPPITNDFIILLKDTALLSVIAIPELLRVAREFAGRYANITSYMGAALIYLVMTLPLTRVVAYMERRLAEAEGISPAERKKRKFFTFGGSSVGQA